MQTNQANDISAAESDANQRRLSLQQTLAQLNDEASKYAMQRYDAAREAEREDVQPAGKRFLQRPDLGTGADDEDLARLGVGGGGDLFKLESERA